MSENTKRTIKKSTITLTGKTVSVTSDTRHPPGVERKFTTRAKDAARRDGRNLFEPVPPPVISKADSASEHASTPSVLVQRGERSGEPNSEAPRRRRPTDAARAGGVGGVGSRTTGDKTYTPREGRGAADRIRSTEPRRGGKLRDRPLPTEYAAPAVVSHPPSPPREDDGMVRVSKLLSEQGLCSRREADSYIARGWVWADGVRITTLGTRVAPTAKLTLDREAAAMQEQRVTILLHKPIGYVSGQAEDGYQPASVLAVAENQVETDTVRFRPEHRRGMAPAGRLDIDSTGLLILTQDGRIAKQLIGENSEVDKEYLVRVEGTLSADDLELLNHGLSLDGEVLKPAIVKWQNEDQLNFILREGKKRQIRRMCEAVGLKVIGLKRIRIGRIKLGDLPVGKWRFLHDDEVF